MEFGGYVVEGLIGRGGMGTVYRGRQKSLGRPVAIKVVRGDADERDFAQRFAREARVAASVSHPNVVHVYDFGSFADGWYLVTELVEGKNLQDVVTERGRIEPVEAASLLLQAMQGLAAIADAGLIHRDIKPGNLLISGGQRLKIADFGLARREAHGDLTMAGQILGTPTYMSLEQWRGSPLDHRTDQYSLGVTAYVMLTGMRPFQGEGVLAILEQVRTLTPPSPQVVDPGIPEALAQVVMRMMAREAEDRFPDHRACIAALDRVARMLAGSFATPATGCITILDPRTSGGSGGRTSSAVIRLAPTPSGDGAATATPRSGTTSIRRRSVLAVVGREPEPPAAIPAAPPAERSAAATISTRRLRGREPLRERLGQAIVAGQQALAARNLRGARQAVEQAVSRLHWLQEDGLDPEMAGEVAALQAGLRRHELWSLLWRIALAAGLLLAGGGLVLLLIRA